MELIPRYLDQAALRCISAGHQEKQHMLDQRSDHIFYTGSANVGKIVHAAAAKRLTPATLELGGLAPATVTASRTLNSLGNTSLPSSSITPGRFETAHSPSTPSLRTAQRTRILDENQCGGLIFNDCTLHAMACDALFGGTGASGQGYYHGPCEIWEVSHLRTYVNAVQAWMEGLLEARYPPYSDAKLNKLAPGVKPPFDREGNDVSSASGRGMIWGLWFAGFALAGAVVNQRQQVQVMLSRFLK